MHGSPLVSICLPNLNTFSYLEERIDSILSQTHTHWEMIVVDSYSTDGSWEFFERLAAKDSRVTIAQAPRGLYQSWNKCIRRATGDYVYVATSDDTMAADCLEKLVAGLEEQEDCDIAHCQLRVIDECSRTVEQNDRTIQPAFEDGVAADRKHIRRAPYDGLLHLSGNTVYTSITQLLIRRSLFDRIGGFKATWGSVGDFYWDMKAGLVANTVHVPDTWASWRTYPLQQTAAIRFSSVEHERKVEEMIRHAVKVCGPCLSPAVAEGLEDYWLDYCRDMRCYYAGLRNRPDFLARKMFQAGQFGQNASVRSETVQRLRGKAEWPRRVAAEIRSWLESLGLVPTVAFESKPKLPGAQAHAGVS